MPFDSETRNDEVAVDVPLPEETAEMSGENGQGWITEEAFFTISPGTRQVRQHKEVKMNPLSPAEKREFLKSIGRRVADPAQEPSSQGTISGRNGPNSSAPARSCDGHSLGPYLQARRKQAIGAPCEGTTLKVFTDPALLDIESHSPTLAREDSYDSVAVRVQPWTQVTYRRRAAGV